MMKDLSHALVAVKYSLLVSPEECTSKLHCEATSIVMRDTYLLMKKWLHIVMLTHQDISYVESLMGMLDVGLDNGGMKWMLCMLIMMKFQRTLMCNVQTNSQMYHVHDSMVSLLSLFTSLKYII